MPVRMVPNSRNAKLHEHRYKRRGTQGGGGVVITATITPATSTLIVGQALQDTVNWSTFLSTGNYASTGGAIDTVVVNYIGSTPDATTAFGDGDINWFSITVTDVGANERTFVTVSRTVAYAAPVAGGNLVDQSFTVGTGIQTYGTAFDFTGDNLTYSINLVAGVTINPSSGVITFDADVTSVQAGTSVVVTATNSGGSVQSGFSLDILQIPAPVAGGNLVNQSFPNNSGDQTYDTSSDFTGSSITYSINSVTGVSINPSTGVVTFDTDAMSIQAGTVITVTATNAGGSDSSSFSVSIADLITLTENVDRELEVNNATGEVTYTITAPAAYAGVYVVNSADLDTGPVNLVPPAIVNTNPVAIDDVLTFTPGLWIYDGNNAAPTITYQWKRDGVNISGATSDSYTLVSADLGTSITVEETATDTNGNRSATSAGVSIPTGSWTELINDDFTGYTLNDTIESNANWTAFSVIGSGRRVVSPVGTGVVDQNGTGTANNNWYADYQGATGNDQAVEVQVSSVTNATRRNDPTIFVRSDGTNNNRNCVRAFWRVSTDEIFFDEYDGAGAIGGQSQTISQAFTDDDILRLEVEGTTAKLFLNGSQIGSDMTGVTVASGTAAFGAYCQANPAGVNYAYVKVEDK